MHPAEFVPMARFLRPMTSQIAAVPAPLPPSTPPSPPPFEQIETIGAARRFRAGLRDAIDAAVPQLLQRIGESVLGRELQLAPADIRVIVEDAIEVFSHQGILAIRAHPHDLPALAHCELERIGDETLQRGEVVLVLRSGTIDLRLPARLDTALATLAS